MTTSTDSDLDTLVLVKIFPALGEMLRLTSLLLVTPVAQARSRTFCPRDEEKWSPVVCGTDALLMITSGTASDLLAAAFGDVSGSAKDV